MSYITHYTYSELLEKTVNENADISFSPDRRHVRIFKRIRVGRRLETVSQTFYAAGTVTDSWGTGYTYTRV